MRIFLLLLGIFTFASCEEQQKDPIKKYGFCEGIVVVESIKNGILYDNPMVVSEWTMKRLNLKQNCRIDSAMMWKIIQSDLELTEKMIFELQSQR